MPPRDTSPSLPAYILAGGRSSRFGSDKARALLDGQPLILRQARLIESFGHRAIVVARVADQYDDLGLQTIADLEPDRGPVGGVLTALRHRTNGWIILTSCDLVVLKEQWLNILLAPVQLHPNIPAVAFHDDRWQPFPCLLHTRLLDQPEAWQRFSLQHFLRTAPAHLLPLPVDWPPAIQANTPEELRRIE